MAMAEHIEHLDWPFFDESHRRLAREATAWADNHIDAAPVPPQTDSDALCRQHVRSLGAAGWLRHCVPTTQGDTSTRIDARALCLLREILATRSALADFAFAMQGLGAAPIALHGDDAQKTAWLPRIAQGEAIAAFALSEPGSGSDVAAIATTATRAGDGWLLNGEKTWISNGGIADVYIVFVRSEDPATTPGAHGLSAFIVETDTPGMIVAERLTTLSPHPLARLRFENCRIPATQLLGQPGAGFKVAMTTLDLFRPTVAAASLGLARRAYAETLRHVRSRRMFGKHLADFQMTQATLADMSTAIDAAALLTYRAAWQYDRGHKTTREAAMAKLFATENTQKVIDAAVQLFGARGVLQGEIVEALYRDIRALRIYEGASEIQKLVIARAELAQN